MQASGKRESYYSLKRASESLFIKVEINDSRDTVISTVQDLGLEQVSYSMNLKAVRISSTFCACRQRKLGSVSSAL